MEKIEIKPGIYWVGGIDWNIRAFHGYLTQRGTTYNAYLIVDEKITLVDTVKEYLFDEMLARIREIVDPSKIEYIVSNHVEMDHSGSLLKMLEHAPGATILTSPQGERGLKRHYKVEMPLRVVKTGETLSLGKNTLTFVGIPMVHWPDSMVTYVAEQKLLLSNDAFGQHIAGSERFDDQLDWGVLKEEASKYYANIVMPYGEQAKKALESLGGLEIEMIAPSHGVIWRSMIPQILEEYGKWANHLTEDRALIVYDTMWKSTEKIAHALMEGMREAGVEVALRCLGTTHMSDVLVDLIKSKGILLGSATLNNGMLPTMGAFLTYVKGLKPRDRVGLAFGSFGWGGQAAGEIEEVMKTLGWDVPFEKVRLNYVPDTGELEKVRETGRKFGEYLKAEDR